MSKKTIVIGTLSSLLVTGGVATAAGILVNAASKNEGISLDQGVNFTVEDINGLLNSFQNEINRNKYTSLQFANKIKDIVSSNLKLEGKNASTLIDLATYSSINKEIVITLKSEYKYTLAQSYSNISMSSSTEDGNLNIMTISVPNLEFYTTYTFSKLNEIYNAFNNIILNSKYTQVEFENYFNENIESIKELVVKSLWTSNTQNINVELIEEISLVNYQVQITFKAGFFSYNLGANLGNITLVNNLMTIRNFNFYKSIVIEVNKLNSLKTNIQNYIDKQDNQFTKEEFIAQVNSLSFKNEVASQLGILSTEINKISYENDILTITPNDMQKFDASVANNNFIINNNIQVGNFNFYESQTLTQTENLFLKLNEYISNAKYTSEEFGDKVNSKDAAVAKIIQDNLLISTPDEANPGQETSSPINTSQILNYIFENNQLSIQLDTNSLKYNLVPTNNVSINNGIITIKNFAFYTSVVIEDSKLNTLKTNVQNLINTNKYTKNDFESQLSSLDFKKSIATFLGIVDSNINTITFSNDTLEITPLQNQKFVSSIPTNNNSNLVNYNVQVSNITFFTSFIITDTNNLFNLLQNYVSSNSETIDEFKTKVNSNDATITSLIQENLLVVDGQVSKPIDTKYITNFEFVNNQLEINLNTNYSKYSLSTNNNSSNVSIQDGKVIVSNFIFFTAISIENDNLNQLQNNVQTLIQNQQYTLTDFKNQLSTLVFKNEIANYLGIKSENIKSITYENDILKVIPQDNQKFVTTALNNSAIVDNTIQITVTKFYDSYTLTNLKQLYDKLNEYIGENKLSQDLFSQRVNDGNTKIQEIIQNNILIANEDNSYPIPPNNILGFNFVNNQLEITLKSDYTKFVTTSTYDNVVLDGNKLIVKNFNYYQIIQIAVDKLNDLKQNIQSLITTNKWTQTDFNNQLSIETFKTSIAGYLGISSSSYIDTMTFTDGNLNISSEVNKKFESTQPTTIINSDDVIVVNGFQFYSLDTLSNFDSLYKAFNKFIVDNKLTVSDFASQVSTNNNAIKQLITENLQVNGTSIESSWINSVSFVNNDATQQLEVTLNNYFVKYNGTPTNTVQIDNNKLIIKNLEYFNLITIDSTNLNGLKDNIQQFIRNSSEQFSSEQFLNQINSNTFKDKIATYLNIDVNAIGNIEFDNNTITISPNSMYKFKSSTDNPLIDDNGIIHVSNFTFFNLYDIANLNNLFIGINTYIAQTNKQFTEEQFANDVSTNPDSIKTVIASNLQLQLGDTTQNVAVENIKTVTYNSANHQLEITLSDNYFKYQQTTTNDNVTLNGDKVIVRNLEFFNEITFNSADLTNLRTNIQNLINDNQVNSNNISSYLNNQIYNLIKDINTIGNGKLEQYIVEPTFSSNSINISLKSNVGRYKFKTSSLSNINITSDQISLNNLTLYTSPTPSPANWFTWDGTRITGLTDAGKSKTEFVLPEFTTQIADIAFLNNTSIITMNASLSKITTIGNQAFNGCSNLVNVKLPNTLKTIGNYGFQRCSSLQNIIIPDSVTSIGEWCFTYCTKLENVKLSNKMSIIPYVTFARCTSLTSIIIPDSITKIDRYAFQGAFLNSINIPSSVNTIAEYAFVECSRLSSVNFLGTSLSGGIGDSAFNNCLSLTSINLPNDISNIGNFTFFSCSKLVSIDIPNSVTVIGTSAFNGCVLLTNISLPNSLTTIANGAFVNCTSLKELTLPNTINSIGQFAFNVSASESSKPLPQLVIFVNSNSVETKVKNVFSGIVINLSRP